jgi:hypothetical protein
MSSSANISSVYAHFVLVREVALKVENRFETEEKE